MGLDRHSKTGNLVSGASGKPTNDRYLGVVISIAKFSEASICSSIYFLKLICHLAMLTISAGLGQTNRFLSCTFCFSQSHARLSFSQRQKLIYFCASNDLKEKLEQNTAVPHSEEKPRRIFLLLIGLSGLFQASSSYGKIKSKNPYDERRLLEQNKRIQRENNAPEDFPNFIREGFEVKVMMPENYKQRDSGLIYRDFEVGKGDCPRAGQQVIFHYIGYNESGRRIDSTYLQGSPAKIRLGTNSLVPGFEEGLQDMRPGGKRRIIIPPELGPPVGPSTFFSSKQFEVFDVELLSIQDCHRRTIGFYSDVVCN